MRKKEVALCFLLPQCFRCSNSACIPKLHPSPYLAMSGIFKAVKHRCLLSLGHKAEVLEKGSPNTWDLK